MAITEIEVRELEEQPTAVISGHLAMSETDRIPQWLQRTYEAVQRSGREPAGMPFLRTLALDPRAMHVEVGWPVPAPFAGDGEVTASRLPGGPAAVVSYFGPYDGVTEAYEALERWCEANGREPSGAPWETYFTDPNEEPDQSKWRTDVHVPLQPEPAG